MDSHTVPSNEYYVTIGDTIVFRCHSVSEANAFVEGRGSGVLSLVLSRSYATLEAESEFSPHNGNGSSYNIDHYAFVKRRSSVRV